MNDIIISYFKIKLLFEPDPILRACSQDIIKNIPDFYTKITFDDCSHDNIEVLIAFLNSHETSIVYNIFKSRDLIIEYQDITQSVIAGDIYHTELSYIFADNKIDLLKDFLLYNVTSDIVLDKITKYGIDSLTEIDKHILNNI